MEFDSGIIVYSPHGLVFRGVFIFTYGHGFLPKVSHFHFIPLQAFVIDGSGLVSHFPFLSWSPFVRHY
jgi:hypothetical protein